MSDQPGELTRTVGSPPLYMQIVEAMLEQIRNDGVNVGDRIASEPQIVATYGVSRATASRALEYLAQQGVVRREQGRGTFVQTPPLVQRQPVLRSFSMQVHDSGHQPTQRVLSFGAPGADEDPRLLGFFGEEPAVLIERLRMIDGTPAGIHRSLVARAALDAAGIDATSLADPGASLYTLLGRAGVQPAQAEEHLDAQLADARECELLRLTGPAALMRVVRLTFDQRGRPLEATDARYLGGRLDYRVALQQRGAS